MSDTDARAREIFADDCRRVHARTDRFFAFLLVAQWVFAVVVAVVWSPYGWAGKVKTVHAHVHAAVFVGAALTSLPLLLVATRPGATVTRHVIAVSQMLWSALLIHLTGGRIETHFHVFGSLAFLAFYRDFRVLVPATLVVVADHFLRGLFWPESVYGIVNPEWWRFVEHALWVTFEDIVLVSMCVWTTREMRVRATQQAELEAVTAAERQKSRALDEAMRTLRASQEQLVRSEKLAAIGQLAASVGHELRNPLFAIRNANAFVSKKLEAGAADHPKVKQFVQLIDRELAASMKIIADLLDFARERKPNTQPCALRPLVDEAIALVPLSAVEIVNEVPPELPLPSLDKDQFRQVLINLVQNGVEAMPADRPGRVIVRATGGGSAPFEISVVDDGPGIPAEIAARIFEPLFTTKTKGTGLGLAIVANMVRAHGGEIRVDTEIGRGSRFEIQLPTPPPSDRPAIRAEVP